MELRKARTAGSVSGAAHAHGGRKGELEDALPVAAVATTCMILFANAFGSLVIFPYMPFLVNSFFPDLTKPELGARVGLLASAYFVGQLAGNMLWGRLSDVYDRRMVMAVGLAGTLVSILAFGLAPSYEMCVAARLSWGFLNGNIGIAKAYLADVCTDATMAQGFSAIGVAGGLGRLFGPVIGAYLVDPGRQAAVLGGTFLADRKFLLPCLAGAVVQVAVIAILVWHILTTPEEATPTGTARAPGADGEAATGKARVSDVGASGGGGGGGGGGASGNRGGAAPSKDAGCLGGMLQLRDPHIFVASSLYWILAVPGIISVEVLSLWAVNPPAFGGYCFKPEHVGNLMMVHAVIILPTNLSLFPYLSRRLGYTALFQATILTFAATSVVLPFVSSLPGPHRDSRDCSTLATLQGLPMSATQAVALVVVTCVQTVSRIMAFTTSFVLINNSCKADIRGAVNGAAQTLVAAARMIAPTLGGLLFQWSVSPTARRSWPLNHHLAWYFCAATCMAAYYMSRKLPPTADRKRT